MIPVDLVMPGHQEVCGAIRRRPVEEELQGVKKARIGHGVRHCPLFGLDVVEVGKPLEKGPQVAVGERAFEAVPPERLRLITATQRLQRLQANVLPGHRNPQPVAELRALEEPQRVARPACREQALRDLGRDLRHLAGLRIVLGDEAVDVALRVRDVLERYGDRARALARPHLVLVGGAARAPAHRLPLVLRRHRHG